MKLNDNLTEQQIEKFIELFELNKFPGFDKNKLIKTIKSRGFISIVRPRCMGRTYAIKKAIEAGIIRSN